MATNPTPKGRAFPITPESAAMACDHLAMARLACAIEAICRLPSIPVADWCDRAAGAIGLFAPRGIIGVVACSVVSTGKIQTILATGAACVGASITETEQTILQRSRLERLAGEAWAPKPAEGPAGVFIPSHAGGVHQDVWDASPSKPVLARLLSCGARAPSLLVYIQTNNTGVCAPLLDAAVPVLARRVQQTTWPTRSNGWVSPSEHGVLDQLVLGLSVREVAKVLNKSPHTVHDHVKSLHRKLGATSRAMVVARALGHPGPIVDVLTDGVRRK